MSNRNQPKIELRKERNLFQLINDSMGFIRDNYRPLSQSIYCLVIPFLLFLFIFNFLPGKITESPLCRDLINIIYRIKYGVGIDVIFTLIVAYLESVAIYCYMSIYYNNPEEKNITFVDVFKKLKENMLSLISVLIVLLVAFSVLLLVLIYWDTDIVEMFGFSLFLVLMIFVPFLCYFFYSILFVGMHENFSLVEASKKVRTYSKNVAMIWLSTTFLLLGFIVVQKIVTLTFTALYSLFTYDFLIKINPFVHLLELLATVTIMAVFSVMSAFLYTSQEENIKGKDLLSRIDEIK